MTWASRRRGSSWRTPTPVPVASPRCASRSNGRSSTLGAPVIVLKKRSRWQVAWRSVGGVRYRWRTQCGDAMRSWTGRETIEGSKRSCGGPEASCRRCWETSGGRVPWSTAEGRSFRTSDFSTTPWEPRSSSGRSRWLAGDPVAAERALRSTYDVLARTAETQARSMLTARLACALLKQGRVFRGGGCVCRQK